MEIAKLLYTLEKVRRGTLITLKNCMDDEHEACEQLERDGLIRRATENEEQVVWEEVHGNR